VRSNKVKQHITIADDGSGIAQSQIDMILQRGGRVDESKPGQGIGLSVIVDIIEAYKGKLVVSQCSLGGAAFQFVLRVG
jgi:two-component system sensor histidine kinase PhoQ